MFSLILCHIVIFCYCSWVTVSSGPSLVKWSKAQKKNHVEFSMVSELAKKLGREAPYWCTDSPER